MIIAAIVLWVVGVAFLFVTIKNIIVRTVKLRRCTASATATVEDIKEKVTTRGRSSDNIGVTFMEYIPTLRYEVDGKEYIKSYSPAYRNDTYKIGNTIEVMYNLKKPSEINKKGSSNKADIILFCLGIVILIVGIVLMVTYVN